MGRVTQPVLAGIVAGLVAFASSFAVVLAGLRGVGATPEQAASGLLAVGAGGGLVAIWLSVRHRMPISIAWSTPGAALLASTGAVEGGFPAAVGAFAVCGLLFAITGLFSPLGRWIAAIPPSLAAAMLAGVLLELCVAPVRALAELPLSAAPVVATWALLLRFARTWAVPAALAVAAVAIAVDGPDGLDGASPVPVIEPVAPVWTLPAMVGIALPLYLVTMAAQNVPGAALLAGYGYAPRLSSVLTGTGLGTAALAPLGGHSINLAAITAALVAGPDAHPDPDRRWIASVGAAATLIVLSLGSGLAVALVLASPPVLVEGVAGLALLGALGNALTTAAADADRRDAVVVTFVVTASPVSIAGIGSAFWGLLAGVVMLALHRRRPRPDGGGAERVGHTAPMNVGDVVEDFELPDERGTPRRLSELLADGPVVLFFYPAAMTPGCTAEACRFRDLAAEFAEAGARPVGISADPVERQAEFTAKHDLGYPLLSDADGEIARRFGVRRGFALAPTKRRTFVIDTDRRILEIVKSEIRMSVHADKALAALRRRGA